MSLDGLRLDLQRELARLEAVERPWLLASFAGVEGGDAADQADLAVIELDLEQLEARIRRLRDRLASVDRTLRARDGMQHSPTTVVLDFGSGPETYLLAEYSYGRLPTITPASPLGRALVGARSGQTVTYRAPRGFTSVVLVGYETEAA
jgi:transcription elongation factor GreA